MSKQLNRLMNLVNCPKCDALLPENNLGLVTPGHGTYNKTLYCPTCGIINVTYNMTTGELTY